MAASPLGEPDGPVRRPFPDPITKPKELQRLTNHPLRLGKDDVPRSFGRVRFLAATRAATPLQSMKVRPDRSTTTEPATSTNTSGQEIGRDDIQLAAQLDDTNVEIGNVADGNAELGQHGVAIPPKMAGGGGRRSVSAFFATPVASPTAASPPVSAVGRRTSQCRDEANPCRRHDDPNPIGGIRSVRGVRWPAQSAFTGVGSRAGCVYRQTWPCLSPATPTPARSSPKSGTAGGWSTTARGRPHTASSRRPSRGGGTPRGMTALTGGSGPAQTTSRD